MARYEFKLTGLTPLLLHADSVDWADHLESWRKDPRNRSVSRAGDDRSPAFTWIGSLYSDGEAVAIPTECVGACLRQAGARVKSSGRKTFKEGAVANVFFEQEHMPLLVDGRPLPMAPINALKDVTDFPAHVAAARKMGFELFSKRARIGKAKHIRVRPKFAPGWTVVGTIDVAGPEMTADVMKMLFMEAGKVGIGDWRPGCPTPGRYGMFDSAIRLLK